MTIEDLETQQLFLLDCISGSIAYGLNRPESDVDKRGVFILPKCSFYGLQQKDQVNDQTNDIVYYELQKFMNLLVKNNPNILELVNMPKECILYQHPLFEQIKVTDFITKKCRHTFAGYAIAQIKKARGLNKKIVNPIEKEQKTILHFCYVHHAQGSIPVLDFLKMNALDQAQCGLVNIPNMKGMHALFHSETVSYAGIISGPKANDISLSSVPKGETPIGVLYFNKDGYSVYCKEYLQYWDWVKKRNESRYQNTLEHGKNYDAKNMMHTFRLLHMAEEIATTGTFQVRRTNDKAFLLKVRSGDFDYEKLVDHAEEKIESIDQLFENSTLPEQLNESKANDLLVQIRTEFYRSK